ncbi:hypothetical protein WMY93_024366 [Mugilogobius chulae]|uniref:Ig-like domain-containing protein n=1 Tax=Mugilogobius chulae TaxID=88201 RepID=A0AAW0MZF0_9GOBI
MGCLGCVEQENGAQIEYLQALKGLACTPDFSGANQQKSCVLPCSFEPGPDPVIHWTKEPHETPVHSYYYNQNQLEDQHQNYTGRTSLFEKQLSTGNASLLLSEVKAPVLSVSLQQEDEQLFCVSENIYPKPSVTWSLSPESVDKPQTFINSSADGLWSVLSSVSLSHSLPHEYICKVSTTHSWRSATYRRNKDIHTGLSHDIEIPCTKPKTPVKSLIWRFNHTQTILNRSRPEPVDYTRFWFVYGVTSSNSLLLKDLSTDHLGLYSCEIATDTEEFFIHTEVSEAKLNKGYGAECSCSYNHALIRIPFVSCVPLESCVLPCSFNPGPGPVVHWIKDTTEDTPVHIYYRNQNQLQDQHQDYTGRTSLFEEQLSTGNASLLLSEVKGQDAGRYKCFTSTTALASNRESYVTLRVEKQDEKLICRSENIYPKPSVTWSLSPESVDKPQTFINPSADGLWSVLSSVSLSHSVPHEYICNVSTTHSWRSATYRRQVDICISTSGVTLIPCTEPKTPVKSLIWRLNHTQAILSRSGPEPVVCTESWRRFVDGVTPSNSLVLKNLSRDHQGLFSCHISTDTEECFIHTLVFELTDSTSYAALICAPLESCVLPCSFDPGPDPVVHWTKDTTEDTPVHIYYRNQNQLLDQHQNYKGRTSLFEKLLSTGNASLLLSEVKVQDEGRYKCFTSSFTTVSRHIYVTLRVEVPVKNVSLHQEEQKLVCRADGLYPKPSLSWFPLPDSVKPNTSVNVSEDGLFSVYSSVSVPQTSAVNYTCNVSTPYSWSMDTITPDLETIAGPRWKVTLFLPFAIWIMVVISVVCRIYFSYKKDFARPQENGHVLVPVNGNENRDT